MIMIGWRLLWEKKFSVKISEYFIRDYFSHGDGYDMDWSEKPCVRVKKEEKNIVMNIHGQIQTNQLIGRVKYKLFKWIVKLLDVKMVI